MKNITYLLGAGASYNSLPVVDGMAERMELFFEYLEFEKSYLSKILNYDLLLKTVRKLLDQSKKRASIDTYAKKLFLKPEESNSDLISLKWLLSSYFIFEQSDTKEKEKFYQKIKNNLSDINNDNERSIREKLINNSSNRIDDRYDVFFATLLERSSESSTLQLPKNIRILSWNYDNQLELSYLDYLTSPFYKSAYQNLDIYPFEDYYKDIFPKIIKLNGSAGLFTEYPRKPEEKLTSFIQKTKKDKLPRIGRGAKNFPDLWFILQGFTKHLENEKSLGHDIPYLNFAWEKDKNTISEAAVEFAKKIMSETEIVVIIGYSFPNFNRTVDREVFKAGAKNIKKIYYQAPDADKLMDRLKQVHPFNAKFDSISDVGQFFIPL